MDQLATKLEIQALWGAALNKQKIEWLEQHNLDDPTRSGPWTREEVHAYLIKHYGINSMKLVRAEHVLALMEVFAGEPIDTPSSEIPDADIPF